MKRDDVKRDDVRRVLSFLIRFLAGILAILITWTAAYFLSPWIFEITGTPSSLYVQQLVTAILGISILILGIRTVSLVGGIRGGRDRLEFWTSMIHVIGQIAEGNFQAKVSVDDKVAQFPNHPFSQLVTSVNHMAEQLRYMEQMRQEFISNVSHEIQSPLTSISGFAKALRNSELSDEDRAHYLDIIEAESDRLSKLSDNLIKLTALESEHRSFDAHTFRLDKQLRSIVLSFEPQWRGKDLELDVNLADVSIEADEALLSQVWINLLGNAIKFTPSGGTIQIHLAQADGQAIVTLIDTGPGIAPEDRDRIFERFYKADKSRNRSIGGSGLGLSIVQKIVELHRGVIDVESELCKGSQFRVHIPLRWQHRGEELATVKKGYIVSK